MEFTTEKVMSRDFVAAHSDESMHLVYFKMKQSCIQYMPVLDKNGLLIGLITEQELNRPKRIQELKLSAVAIMDKKQVLGIITAADLLKVLVPLLTDSANQREILPAQPEGLWEAV